MTLSQSNQAELDFRLLADNAPVMIWRSGPDKRVTWFNQPWLSFTGRRLDDEIGEGWRADIHPDDLDHVVQTYYGAFDRREAYSTTYRVRRYDGVYRWLKDHGRPYWAADGAFRGFIGSCIDITEQKEAQERLAVTMAALEKARQTATALAQESDRQFRLLVDSVVDYAIFMLDPNGYVTQWNRGAERIKGYRAEEIIGQHFSRFYTPEDRRAGAPARALAEAARTGKFEAEGLRVRKDGTRFWAFVVMDAIRDEHGNLVGFAKITRDITGPRETQALLERTREQLFHAQKMEAVGQLTGGVAHDFNNLLTIVMGNLETAQRAIEAKAESWETRVRRALDHAAIGAKRAATLTQRLLAFSRRQPLNPKPVDVNRLLSGLSALLKPLLGESVDIEIVGAGGLWPVEADPAELEAAILNLAVNARDAMPDGGKLTIEASNAFLDEEYARHNAEVAPGQYVEIAVTDNGVGMAPDVLARAVEPFFTTKTMGHGTGLGLSQVYGFARQSGGHLRLYSEAGQGTTVRLYLPRLTGEAVAEERPKERPAVGAGETILVVEDDHDVRAYVAEVLADLGYTVLEAPDADAALRIIETGTGVQLLLTDVVLPGTNGRELSERAHAVLPGLKTLFMTGYSRDAIVHQGRLDPGVELIQKPLTQTSLAARIRDLLDRRS